MASLVSSIWPGYAHETAKVKAGVGSKGASKRDRLAAAAIKDKTYIDDLLRHH